MPVFHKPTLEFCLVLLHRGHAGFVSVALSEDDCERDAVLDEPVSVFQVLLHRGNGGIDQKQDTRQVGASGEVLLGEFLPFCRLLSRRLGESVSGKVDDPPLLIDQVMVDVLGRSRLGRHRRAGRALCQ